MGCCASKENLPVIPLHMADTRKRTFELIICSRSQEDI